MITEASEVFTLHIERCRTNLGRYEWIVRSDQHVVRRSVHSASTAHEAQLQGRTALQELTALWRDSR
jgi:hypothetical protein